MRLEHIFKIASDRKSNIEGEEDHEAIEKNENSSGQHLFHFSSFLVRSKRRPIKSSLD
jgi:hypothetical protein